MHEPKKKKWISKWHKVKKIKCDPCCKAENRYSFLYTHKRQEIEEEKNVPLEISAMINMSIDFSFIQFHST